MDTKISVIIPVYRAEAYLRQCLDSVVDQTYKNLEIILIDDGSPDSCGAICDEYAARDERIVVVHKENEGVSIARNIGIDMSHGEWIAFADPDDWLEPDLYEKAIEAIDGRSVDVFCTGGAFFEYQKHSQIRARIKKDFCYCGKDYASEREPLQAKVFIWKIDDDVLESGMLFDMPWNTLYRSGFMKKRGMYFLPHLHPLEDTLLNYKIFDQAVSVAGSRMIGYHYRQTNALSATKHFQADAFRQLCVFLEELDAYRRGSIQGASQRIDDAIAARALGEFIRCMRNQFFHRDAGMTRKQCAEALRAAKHDPRFRWTYRRWSCRYLTKGAFLVKCALLLPGVWQLRACNGLLAAVREWKQKANG